MSTQDSGDRIPWDENTSDDWLNQVNDWPWSPDANHQRWIKSGLCPRCNHQMDKVLELQVVTEIAPHSFQLLGIGSSAGRPKLPLDVDISCNCDQPHEGRPEGQSGCGFAGKGLSAPRG
jgi:hypothetical protein